MSEFELEYVFQVTQITQLKLLPQPAMTCSKLTIETLEQGVEYAHLGFYH